MSVSGLGFTRTVTSKMWFLAKKIRLPLLICKIVAVLFFTLFSGNAALAGLYTGYTYDQLVSLKSSLEADAKKYRNKSKQYYDTAQGFKYSNMTLYNKYMGLSIQYDGKAIDADKDLLGVINEMQLRNQKRVTKITVTVSQSSVKLNSSVSCYCNATYSDGSVATVSPSWSVSNSSYGYISGSTFYPLSAGSGKTVTVKASYNGFSASKTISIAKAVTVVSLSISGDSSVPYCGKKSYTCKAKYSNNSVATVNPTWSVSNTKYGSFSGNKFTAKAAGAGKSVTITATFGGKSVKKKLTIKNRVLSSVSIKGAASVNVGAKTTLSCVAKYNKGSNATVKPKWSSSNTKVATVSSSGVVTGKKGGSVTIKATYKENGVTKTASKKITVSKKLTGITISGASSLLFGKSTTMTCYAKYNDGSKSKVTPSWSVTEYHSWPWRISAISGSGVLKYQKASPDTNTTVAVRASYKGYSASKNVTFTTKGGGSSSGGLAIYGPSTLKYSGSGTYYLYQNGKKVTSASVSWSSSGKCVMADQGSYGLLKATNKPVKSTETVTVIAQYNGKRATRSVKITR